LESIVPEGGLNHCFSQCCLISSKKGIKSLFKGQSISWAVKENSGVKREFKVFLEKDCKCHKHSMLSHNWYIYNNAYFREKVIKAWQSLYLLAVQDRNFSRWIQHNNSFFELPFQIIDKFFGKLNIIIQNNSGFSTQ
jgi:hypothetical protein